MPKFLSDIKEVTEGSESTPIKLPGTKKESLFVIKKSKQEIIESKPKIRKSKFKPPPVVNLSL